MSNQPKTENYAERAANEPTDLHKNFAAWIEAKTGVKPDLKTVQLACSLRMDFQASPENQKHLAERKAKAAAAKKASAAQKKAKLEAQLAKLKADLEKVETEPAAEVQPASKTAPAKKAVTAKATDKPARAPRTRRTAAPKTAPKVVADVPEDFDRVDLDEPATKPVRRTRRATAAKTATTK